MAKPTQPLSHSEWLIMKAVWQLSRTTIREVLEELADETEWAYSTVKTMMERLEDKGYLSSKKVGGSRLYTANIAEDKVKGTATRGFLKQVFDGSIKSMVHCLVNEEDLTDEEAAELTKLLNARKREKKK